jgi:hypothetical protein
MELDGVELSAAVPSSFISGERIVDSTPMGGWVSQNCVDLTKKEKILSLQEIEPLRQLLY